MINRTVERLQVLSCAPKGKTKVRTTPLLFVHGAFAGAWVWDEHFLPYFAERGYHAHALSLRGHGESHGGDNVDAHSVNDYVDDLATVIGDLSSPPVLIGHSMGGFVVQKYLERHPVPGAVLMCSVPPQGLVAAQFSLLFQKPGLMFELNRLLSGENVSPEVLGEALFAQEVPAGTLERYFRKMQHESQRAIWDMSMFNLPLIDRMHRTPLLVLGAERDLLIPAFLVQATAQTYGVHAKIFSGLGHAVMLEQGWEHAAETIGHWLAEQGI